MKWLLSVTDTQAKDLAFKLVSCHSEEVADKLDKYQKRYDAIEQGRFKVAISSQYSELASIENIILICDKPISEISSVLKECDIFMYDKNGYTLIETTVSDVEQVKVKLSEAKVTFHQQID